MFLPTTKKEIEALGWDTPDVILVSGDSYIDSPHMGIAVVGHILANAGYHTAIIAQPNVDNADDICRLGEPKLFWGVSGGAVDSMVSNYTAAKKPRKNDDYTPGGVNNRRPDRACLVYTNLIRKNFKATKPIVLGGIEASLRRIAHYDFWTNKVRASILFDSKADYLLFGMADQSVLDFAFCLKKGLSPEKVRGLAYKSRDLPSPCIELPSLDEVREDPKMLIKAHQIFYENCDAVSGKRLAQKHDDRYLILNAPPALLSQTQLDNVYALPFERAQHPYYEKQGKVKALETIRFSVTTHRGCYGECNFCAIAVHEGRAVQWRSEKSILDEIERISKLPDFKGYISDLGGPTANMYGFECAKKLQYGACRDKRCLLPKPCPSLSLNHNRLIALMQKARRIPGVKKVFVASGIRYDLILNDPGAGTLYLEDLCRNHISGQMKIAPEHHNANVLALMGKPGKEELLKFKEAFERVNQRYQLNLFLTYYFIAAHPGCSLQDMKYLRLFVQEQLKTSPEQVQIFTPTPLTWSTVMYATELNPFSGDAVFVEKDGAAREKQKTMLTGGNDSPDSGFKARGEHSRDRNSHGRGSDGEHPHNRDGRSDRTGGNRSFNKSSQNRKDHERNSDHSTAPKRRFSPKSDGKKS